MDAVCPTDLCHQWCHKFIVLVGLEELLRTIETATIWNYSHRPKVLPHTACRAGHRSGQRYSPLKRQSSPHTCVEAQLSALPDRLHRQILIVISQCLPAMREGSYPLIHAVRPPIRMKRSIITI